MCNYQYSTWECREGGYLWDADDEGYDPEDNSLPCPRCNTREFLEKGAEEARGGGAGSFQFWQYSAASKWRTQMDMAIKENASEAYKVLSEIGPIETDDFADIDHPNWEKTAPCIVVPPQQP